MNRNQLKQAVEEDLRRGSSDRYSNRTVLTLLKVIEMYSKTVEDFIRYFDEDDAKHMMEHDDDWMGHECTVALGNLRTVNARATQLEQQL